MTNPQPTLWDIPSGPSAEIPSKEAGSYAAYREWRETDAGRQVWETMRALAQSMAEQGERRIGTKALTEHMRRHLKVHVNNSWVSWLSDDLIEDDPRLLGLIERRRRRKAKA